jgi:hypothetical protein
MTEDTKNQPLGWDNVVKGIEIKRQPPFLDCDGIANMKDFKFKYFDSEGEYKIMKINFEKLHKFIIENNLEFKE